MKVLVISAAFPPIRAGESDHALHLCQHLTDEGVDVEVLTSRAAAVSNNDSIVVHPVMPSWSWIDLPRMCAFIKRVKPDAVLLIYIGWIYDYHPMMTFIPTVCRSLVPGVPVVTLFENVMGAKNDETPAWTKLIRRAVEHWAGRDCINYSFGTLLRDSDRIIVLSDHHRRLLGESQADISKKTVLIPPAPILRISLDSGTDSRRKGRELLRVAEQEIIIIYFGYIYPNKGIETLLRAFQRVSLRHVSVRLLVVGGVIAMKFPDRPSYAEEISALTNQLGIADKVIWAGGYEWDSELPSIYLRSADICVMPIDVGVQLNNSSFAAATHGLPIVATRGESIEAPFRDRENVLLCPPKDPEAMASAIETVICDTRLKASLKDGALRMAREWFSWDHVTERILATLRLQLP